MIDAFLCIYGLVLFAFIAVATLTDKEPEGPIDL